MGKTFRYEQAIKLRQEGKSLKEIASLMGIEVCTVQTYLYKCLHKQKLLEKQRRANRRFYQRHKKEISKRRKKWRKENLEKIRETTLCIVTKNGKNRTIYGLKKRKRPEECELCGKKRRLVYHHWDDSNYNKGMWICRGCHLKVEWMERGGAKKYENLKNKIEEEYL